MGHNTPLDHHTDHGPIGPGQYNGIGEYWGPSTASSVFLKGDIQRKVPKQENVLISIFFHTINVLSFKLAAFLDTCSIYTHILRVSIEPVV